MPRRSILILGGTAEAAALAQALADRYGAGIDVTTSLAGRTTQPVALPGTTRTGGFGGVAGLAAWLREHLPDAVIDATHPFATEISRHAVAASAGTGIPCLRLDRPPWSAHPDDRWIAVPDPAGAAEAAAGLGRRLWLTLGRREIGAFAGLPDNWCLVRMIEPPPAPLPLADYTLILGRGPFDLAGERRAIAEHGIDVLVTKASGGTATEAKLIAAREAGLPVVMIRRPPPLPGDRVTNIDAALEWLGRTLS